MITNKVFAENSVVVRQLLEIRLNKPTNEPTIEDHCSLDGIFIGVYFSTLMHNNQIFRNDFVCNYYQLCKQSAKTIQYKI